MTKTTVSITPDAKTKRQLDAMAETIAQMADDVNSNAALVDDLRTQLQRANENFTTAIQERNDCRRKNAQLLVAHMALESMISDMPLAELWKLADGYDGDIPSAIKRWLTDWTVKPDGDTETAETAEEPTE